MANPVQPVLHDGQLRLLMDEQHESETLDYKSRMTTGGSDGRAFLVELAKDVGAMASGLGGYIAIGLDERGRPTGSFTTDEARELDEARLRQKLQRYLPDGIDLRTAAHEIDGHLIGLVYVGAHPDGLVVFKADGTYQENGRETVVFREGDVFVRRGTQSRRWSQEEARGWMREQARQLREEALAEAAAAFRSVREESTRAADVAHGPASALNWNLDARTLVSAVTDQFRRSDDIPFRLLIESAPRVARDMLQFDTGALQGEELTAAVERADSDLGGLLDRLVALAARGIALERRDIVDPALDALVEIYNAGFSPEGMDRTDLAMPAARLWLMIIERLYALGAVAARRKDWRTIRRLAEARPATYASDYYLSLLRHGHIMAARAGLLADPSNSRVGASLLNLALQDMVRVPDLRADLGADDDRLLSSLCQFDLLVNVATVDVTDRFSGAVLYPHFKRFYSRRSDPAAVALITDRQARSVLFNRDDQELSNLLASLGRLASSEFFFVSGWDGYSDPVIKDFLGEHPPEILADAL